MRPLPGDAISAATDVLADRWTLLILRDVILSDRRHFRALLTGSDAGIASNILADRLVRLVEAGILRRGTAARGQRARYSLTEAGIRTVPILHALGTWGLDWRGDADAPPRSGSPAEELAQLERLMDDLRARHLGDAVTNVARSAPER
ncbi:winged helix-turn-helix transcriptional regulator [Parafrigoribacterium soli]|uniref:winged helix-turn-helix transcriptional regulator n=1 Tax=Parafrigoribacterium soli TaxID=3144663 RepID=UPI0032EE2534